MKAFFEEYGFIVLSAIVVLLLIAMAEPIGNTIRDSAEEIATTFAETVMNEMPN